MRNVWIMAWFTFQEARRKWLVVAALLLGVAVVLVYSAGFAFITNSMRNANQSRFLFLQGVGFMMLAGMYGVHFLSVLLTVFTSVDTLAGDIASHTIQAVVTKPIRRWQIVVGKWLGFAVMLLAYEALLGTGIIVATNAIAGYLPPNPAEGLAILLLTIPPLLALSLLGGIYLSSLTNGVALVMLYGLSFIGSWMVLVGKALQVREAGVVGVVIDLLLPVESLFRRAALVLEPPLLHDLNAWPFSEAASPSALMIPYSIGYSVVILALAARAFTRRDL